MMLVIITEGSNSLVRVKPGSVRTDSELEILSPKAWAGPRTGGKGGAAALPFLYYFGALLSLDS